MSTDHTIQHFESGADSQTFTMSDPGQAAGENIATGLRVFRAATFKDSRGRQKTWSAADLVTMASNFKTLLDRNIFTKVPVRVDHEGSAKSVVGWLKNVHAAGEWLMADVEFTEPDALAKFTRGTYGPRSLEVGTYETNGETPERFYPTVMGLAFVDIPAVEGLHGKQTDTSVFSIVEEPMPELHVFKVAGADQSDYAKVQAYIADLEAKVAAKPAEFIFKLNGADDINDFAKVQAHVVALEKQVDEHVLGDRRSFVKALVTEGKMAAPQAESMTKLVEGMSPDQFTQFQAGYANAPALSLFQRHTDGITNPNGDADSTKAADLKTAEAQVDMLRRSGRFDNGALEKTEAFRKLTALKTAQ